MKRVLTLDLHGNKVAVYEQELNDEILYTAYLIVGKKKYYLDDFDSLTEALHYSMQFCYDN